MAKIYPDCTDFGCQVLATLLQMTPLGLASVSSASTCSKALLRHRGHTQTGPVACNCKTREGLYFVVFDYPGELHDQIGDLQVASPQKAGQEASPRNKSC